MKLRNMILIGLVAMCLIGTTPVQALQAEKEGKIGVIVTILPQAEFVEKIGGNRVSVMVMVPPGASPHSYEPKPDQLVQVSKAKMYAKVGSGVEFERVWMDKIINTNREMVVVNCSRGIELIEGDPHVWLSPKNAKIMVDSIYKGLAQIDPSNSEYYSKNREAYLRGLDDLNKGIAESLSGMKNRKILVYHPAWGYFCRDYNLEQLAIEKEGKEPTPRGIASAIEQAKENNITVVFASPQFNQKSAEVIAREINGKVILIDPLAKNYTENLRKVAESLAKI